VGLVTAAIGAWILWQSRLRRTVLAFAGGALLAGLIPAAFLASQGALAPMLKSMAWNSANYSAANRIAYGALFDNPLNFWPPRMRSGRRLRCWCSRRCCPPSFRR
jgi:hypothetical protein